MTATACFSEAEFKKRRRLPVNLGSLALCFIAAISGNILLSLSSKAQNQRPPAAKPPIAAKPDAAKAEQPPASLEEPPPPYEPQLLRLSEILGALTYLRDICGDADAASWRGRMQALLDAEAKSSVRKEHLAGAFNRGFHGYELSYRVCTPNAQLIIKRFLTEGEQITHDVTNRYSAS
jgi:uncharacterized protein (TIGR02301 family)